MTSAERANRHPLRGVPKQRLGVRVLVPWVLALMLGAASVRAGEPWPPGEPFHVGIVLDGPWQQNEEFLTRLRRETLALTAGEHDVRFQPEHIASGDWAPVSIEAAVDRLVADPEVDLVLALGVVASHRFCCRADLPKPVIAAVVVDAELQGLPRASDDSGASGVPNLAYIAFPSQVTRQLETFRRIVAFERLTFLTNLAYQSLTGLADQAEEEARAMGLEATLVPVGESVEEALAAIPEDTEAVYVFPLLHLSDEQFRRLATGLAERRLPSFSLFGREDVERGVMAGFARDSFLPRLARRVALDIQRILLGEDAGEIPVDFTFRDRLLIELDVARAVGVSPRWEMLLEAETLGDEHPGGAHPLTLRDAVAEAVEANLDLAAQARAVAAGEQEVAAARAVLRPQLDAAALGFQIDEDRAAASLGSQPERSLTGSLGLTQLLYSDAARGNVAIQRQLQLGRAEELEALRLDIALEAAVTYLNLLRAQSLERVQRANLEVTRSNLELAQVRRSLGVAGAAEVHRWESQIATDRRALIEAGAARRIAEIALARLLHRGLDESFQPSEVSEDALLTLEEARARRYTDTPRSYRLLSDFLVAEGLASAPELARFDAALAAQRRVLTTAKRSFWSPTIAAQAGLDELLSEGGAGTSGSLGGSGGGGIFTGLPSADDTSWSVGIRVSLPLWTGGSRVAERLRATEELSRLDLERRAVAERIEQRIRTALEAARASGAGVTLSRQAADAAQRNLELVVDAYTRGAVSILDLLDAQNAALRAEEAATNAVYDFLIDVMETQRAANRFEFFLSPEAIRDFYDRLEREVETP